MRRNRQAGQALVFAALGMTVLLGFAGLGIDLGVLRYEKRLQQTAADAAAIAGANQLRFASAGITSAGQDAAVKNGFTDNGGGNVSACSASAAVGTICVQVQAGPTSGPHAGNANYVEAIVAEVRPTYFLKALNITKQVVAARGVATMLSQTTSQGPGCIYTLGPPGTGIGVTNNGTPTVNATTCGIYDGGDWTTNGKKVDINAGEIGVTGTSSNHGGGTVTCSVSSLPCPQLGLPPVTDPLAGLPAPTVGTPTAWNSSNPVPGTYSGISIAASTTVNFAPGVYVIDGGSFTVNGGATVCNQTGGPTTCSATGTPNAGVTFYLTNGASVTVNGNSGSYLAAPNSGTYAGILFDQDPTDCSTAKLDGTSNSYYQGALYFPGDPAQGCNVELDFGGTMTNTTAAYTVIVTDDLKFNGTPTVNINSNYSSLPGGTFTIKNAILVE